MLTINPGSLSLAQLQQISIRFEPLELARSCRWRVDQAATSVSQIVAAGVPVYGINTGFGKLASVQISEDRLDQLQGNLVRSHAVGVGPLLADATVRLVLALKIASLGRGYSGVRLCVLDTLCALYNAGIWPCIPAQGSVGASGDLAPLAHLALAAMGEGTVRVNGGIMPAGQALQQAGIEPIQPAAKEGLALLNGTQVSTAIALRSLFQVEQVFSAAVIAGALTVDAAAGSDAPFDPRIHAVRGQRGQICVAEYYRGLLAGSEIRESHRHGDSRVQDPYSLRCQPQVMGACFDVACQAAKTLLLEANAVSDNPLVFVDDGAVLSGGNFHAEPVAFAADQLAIAGAEIGAMSERRIALLIDAAFSGLPAFLVEDAGLNSGFMVAHVTAASLASENKTLAHPASVDSMPTSANQEDHVSMATFAARKAGDVAINARRIVAIELLAACQGIEFRRPLRSSKRLEAVHAKVRREVPVYADDRVLAPDIEAVDRLVMAGVFSGFVDNNLLDPVV